MAHFAKIENNIVKNVIVLKNSDCGGGDFPASEAIGQAFIASLGFAGTWLQTSYSKSFRGQYAGIGMTYNPTLDCFHSASPYPSWILQSNGTWKAPVAMPQDEKKYRWDELSISWIELPTTL